MKSARAASGMLAATMGNVSYFIDLLTMIICSICGKCKVEGERNGDDEIGKCKVEGDDEMGYGEGSDKGTGKCKVEGDDQIGKCKVEDVDENRWISEMLEKEMSVTTSTVANSFGIILSEAFAQGYAKGYGKGLRKGLTCNPVQLENPLR